MVCPDWVESRTQGRQRAFEHGKVELMNYAQVTDLEAQGLVIETHMTYEEANPDSSITVFRLLRVPVPKLLAIQGRLQAKSRVQEQALEKVRQELVTLQQSLSQKQQELEARTRSVQESLSQITQLQASLSDKAQRIDQQQGKVEQLLQQLNAKIHVQGTPSQSSRPTRSVLGSLKEAEAQLDERERDLDQLSRKIQARIQAASQKACRYVTAGMKPSEVRSLLGEPDGRTYPYDTTSNVWSYGETKVHFGYDTPVVSYVSGCRNR